VRRATRNQLGRFAIAGVVAVVVSASAGLAKADGNGPGEPNPRPLDSVSVSESFWDSALDVLRAGMFFVSLEF